MNIIFSIIIFIIIVFIYIHIIHQYKKSEDLEIYELDYKGIDNLQDTCDVRQPVVFYFDNLIQDMAPINLEVLSDVEKEDGNTLNIKDINEYYLINKNNEETIVPTEVSLSFQSTLQLLKTDSNIRFFTENNNSFIEDTGLDTLMVKIGNLYLKPQYTFHQSFDIMTGTNGIGLPMRFHTNTRKFIYISSGRIIVKMAPFKNIKKLKFIKNSKISPINCWNPQKEYISAINKTRFLEFDVSKGNILYIPPYWIYSLKYVSDNVCLLEYNYRTLPNIIAHLDEFTGNIKQTINSIFMSKKTNEDKCDEEQSDEKDIKDDDDNDNNTSNNIIVNDNITTDNYDLRTIIIPTTDSA